MNSNSVNFTPTDQGTWLRQYYFARAVFSIVWVVAALTFGKQASVVATLLAIYPIWDATANYVDASRNGGLAQNRTQAFNVAVSLIVALGVIVSLTMSMNWVLSVFGAWAIFSGLLQLGTAIRRWKTVGGQWAMILSGAQSSVAGVVFISMARLQSVPSIGTIIGYAGFGAFYFLVSAIWLTVSRMRRAA